MKIVGILGSPSVSSRSGTLLQHAQAALQDVASSLHTISVRELPAEALLHAQFDHPLIRQALHEVHEAQVVLVSTPIYKAAYSGLLKAFLDLLPQDGLRDKTIVPLATGGSIAHLLALDYALKPVLSALGARDILDPVFATDPQIPKHDTEGYRLLPEVQERLGRTLQTVVARNDEFLRQEDAAREREALLSRLQVSSHDDTTRWASSDVRWST
ncbi:NADPH-dependent FMN reductase [Rhizobacter sp. Root1221]|uniref:NADPH-dependent FMN reductase n=1 Tax=Rhizobacter sp. Root1221 TaxID=1736433 RepID=UPI0006F5A48F|nr:NADPH-dependent FMN reductase [Rhizobacter sp. Root1221]KQW03106.1 NADPH-dependent FMN reductase [Rhizobacter sp. Root1221]